MSSDALQRIPERVREACEHGPRPVLVFDLDSTLFELAPRHMRILRDFVAEEGARYPKIAEIVDSLALDDMGWFGVDAVRERGGEGEGIKALVKFWRRCFFTNEYCREDEPMPGAAEYVRACHDAGGLIYYLTGRAVQRMQLGTVEALVKHGFPFAEGRCVLHLKPDLGVPDREFKKAGFESALELTGQVLATWENEPGNANLFHRRCPEATHFFVRTVHSPGAEPPLDALVTIDGFADFS